MRLATAVFMLVGAYATARYNLFADVPWSDWPTHVLNKIFALSALALFALPILRKGVAADRTSHPILGIAAFFAAIHVLLSLAMLSPAYYGKLYNLDRFTASAGVAMLLGVLAAAALAFGGKLLSEPDAPESRRHMAVLAFFIGLHAAFQGYFGWFTPWKWPAFMPPITLISCVLGTAALCAGLRTVKTPPAHTANGPTER